jgi:hypothetical protein
LQGRDEKKNKKLLRRAGFKDDARALIADTGSDGA